MPDLQKRNAMWTRYSVRVLKDRHEWQLDSELYDCVTKGSTLRKELCFSSSAKQYNDYEVVKFD